MVQQRSPARLGTTLALTNASQQVFSGGVEDFERQNSVWLPLQGAPREDVMKRNLIRILSLVVMSLLLNATGAYALPLVVLFYRADLAADDMKANLLPC
jgi:hypothetical protein